MLSKLFNFFIASTVVLYLFAILYRLSPDTTLYSITDGVCSGSCVIVVGIFNTFPTLSVFDVKLFNDFNSSTVIPNLFAIPYSVSPL